MSVSDAKVGGVAPPALNSTLEREIPWTFAQGIGTRLPRHTCPDQLVLPVYRSGALADVKYLDILRGGRIHFRHLWSGPTVGPKGAEVPQSR